MLLKAIENRLSTSRYQVKGAVEFAALDKKPIAQPTVFVLSLGYKVSSNQRDSGPALVRQNDTVGIVIAVRNAHDSRGKQAKVTLDEYRQSVRNLLFGWVPNDGYEPLMISNGRLLKFKEHTVFWLDEFTTSHLEQAPQ